MVGFSLGADSGDLRIQGSVRGGKGGVYVSGSRQISIFRNRGDVPTFLRSPRRAHLFCDSFAIVETFPPFLGIVETSPPFWFPPINRGDVPTFSYNRGDVPTFSVLPFWGGGGALRGPFSDPFRRLIVETCPPFCPRGERPRRRAHPLASSWRRSHLFLAEGAFPIAFHGKQKCRRPIVETFPPFSQSWRRAHFLWFAPINRGDVPTFCHNRGDVPTFLVSADQSWRRSHLFVESWRRSHLFCFGVLGWGGALRGPFSDPFRRLIVETCPPFCPRGERPRRRAR